MTKIGQIQGKSPPNKNMGKKTFTMQNYLWNLKLNLMAIDLYIFNL